MPGVTSPDSGMGDSTNGEQQMGGAGMGSVKVPLEDILGNLSTAQPAGDGSRKQAGFNFSNLQMPSSWPSAGMAPALAQKFVVDRFQALRPWTVFLSSSRFRRPPSLTRLHKRMLKNAEYFQSNYVFVFLGLVLYCLLTSPLLLIVLAAAFGGCYIVRLHNQDKKIELCRKEVPLSYQYAVVWILAVPLLHYAGAGSIIFWVLGASCFLIVLHAAFFNIESVLQPGDEDRFDLEMEQV